MKNQKLRQAKRIREKMTVAEFCELSGFERSWLSRLAADGHFPPSENGVYQRDAAIRGLLRYLRDRNQLNLQKVELNAIEIEIKKIELEELKGQYLSKEKVCADMKATGLGLRGMFQRAFETEWPAKAVGKTQIELMEIGRAMTDKLCAEFRARAERWMK